MGEKTMEQNTKQGMEKNDVLKQFMELLNLQSMGEQSQDFMEFFQYVAGMQLQLGMMMDELQDIKEPLSQMQGHQPKSVAKNLMDMVLHFQKKITNLSEHLSAVKKHLVEIAAQAVSVFKEKGKTEMCKVLQKGISGVEPILADYRKQVVDVMTDYEKTANQIDSIEDELKQIGNSVSNTGRVLAGKGTKEISDEKPSIELTRIMNKSGKKVVGKLRKNVDAVNKALEKLERLFDHFDARKEAEEGECP